MLEDQKVLEKIIEILNNIGIITAHQTISGKERLEELILDSLTFISFIMELEQTFDIEIGEEFLMFELWQTLGDAKEIVKKCMIK